VPAPARLNGGDGSIREAIEALRQTRTSVRDIAALRRAAPEVAPGHRGWFGSHIRLLKDVEEDHVEEPSNGSICS
jgi:hypothetical protein